MSPIEAYIAGRFVGTSGSGFSSIKDAATNISINYFGDHLGAGVVFDGAEKPALRFKLQKGQGVKRPVMANGIPAVENGQPPTPVEREVLVKRV